jgi:general secretion pathway protein D
MISFESRRAIWRLLPAAGLLILGAGCAGGQLAYHKGKTLAAQGQKKEALAKFEEAVAQNSSSAEYRIAAIQTREELVKIALNQADNFLGKEQFEEARASYHQALSFHPNNARALEGLSNIQIATKHNKWLANAKNSIEKNSNESEARNWLRMVLAENPKNVIAINMLETLEAEQPKKPTAATLATPFRTPITIEFKDAPIKTVFEVISRTSGLNFLFDKDVKTDQKTSIFLKNSTTEAAINLTLLTNQLEMRIVDANTILIYPNTQAKQKDYQALVVKTFYLANAEAKSVANTLKTILKSKDIVVDEKLNVLILRDTPEAIRLASKLVAVHDVSDSEVMLEVEILEVKRTRLLDLGIQWADQLSLSPIAAASGSLTLADLRSLNSDTTSASIGPTTITARNVDTDANILANPRIRVRNREKAKILIGERVPNITSTSTATGFVGESITYVDVGLKLDVEPTISVGGEVSIKIALEVSNIISQVQTKSGSLAFQIGTRTAQTMLRLKDGENQVLAGLINNEDRNTANKIPFIGNIPLIGRLFGQHRDEGAKTEIVLSITPRILRNLERPGESSLEFDSGTESNLNGFTLSNAGAVKTPNQSTLTPIPATTNTPASSPTPKEEADTPTPADAATISWQGPPQAKVGDTITLQLMMQSTQPLISVPMALGFDPLAFQVVSLAEGDFLKQGGATTNFTSRIDPSGQILITGTRNGDTGATAAGSMATINLRVLGAPGKEAPFKVLALSPVALGGKSINAPLPAPFVVGIEP